LSLSVRKREEREVLFELLRSLLRPRGCAASTAALPIPQEVLASFSDSDRFIVSYPRSGNTWLRHLLQEVIVAQHPDLPRPGGLEAIQPTVHFRSSSCTAPDDYLPWRLWKSHNIRDIRGHYMVYLFRVPADAVVSYYHLASAKVGAETLPAFDSFCTTAARQWKEHAALGLEQKARYPDRTMFVSYERLQENTALQLRRVTDFLDLDPDDTQIAGAVEMCAFERLREREYNKNPRLKEREFFRKGRVGGGAEELKPRVKQIVEDVAMPYYERALELA
jgi:estrone sulfotransferase